MSQNPGATTRTVQPTPQIDSLRISGYEQTTASNPVSPEVARYQIEQQLAHLARMANLTTADLNNASLHHEVRAMLEGKIDIYEEPVVSENLWTDGAEPVIVEDAPREAELTGEAATTAAIENLQSNEKWYQIISATGPQLTGRLRVDGLAHPEQLIERVKADYELAA